MKYKLKEDENTYFLNVYDNDPKRDQINELLTLVKAEGRNFYPRRRYPDGISYRVILNKETLTYIHLIYGSLIAPRNE